jgi:hypothetical protein
LKCVFVFNNCIAIASWPCINQLWWRDEIPSDSAHRKQLHTISPIIRPT